MLMLLKPWRTVEDLRGPEQSWIEAFENFAETAPARIQRIISGVVMSPRPRNRLMSPSSGIEYFHQCRLAAQNKGPEQSSEPELSSTSSAKHHGKPGNEPTIIDSEPTMTPHQIEEDWHGRLAVETARLLGIFQTSPSTWQLSPQTDVILGDTTNRQQLLVWKKQLESDANARNTVHSPDAIDDTISASHNGRRNLPPSVSVFTEGDVMDGPILAHQENTTDIAGSTGPITNDRQSLSRRVNEEQVQAHDMIITHLKETLAGKEPYPLRMMVYGEGGTGKCRLHTWPDTRLTARSGKSTVIDMTTDSFVDLGVDDTLVKTAYTGVAASGIDGKTCHVVGSLSLSSSRAISKETASKLREFWRGRRYLIIDEFSMIGKSFLARLSHNISIGMEENNLRFKDHSFGGLNVIIFGDLHQFPPVAAKRGEALYRPLDITKDTIDAQLGRRIYDEFTKVVVLRQQNRVTDPDWKSMLTRLRMGDITDDDITMLKSLVLTPAAMNTPEMLAPEWRDACLITPRHSVRIHWNDAALKQWSARSGNRILVCTAEDTLTSKKTSKNARILPTDGNRTEKQWKTPPRTLHIAVGMKVMITENLETDLDITNGARGHIVRIVLDPNEPALTDDTIVHLKYLPIYILVKLDRTKASRLPGLETGVIPIEPRTTSMKFTVEEAGETNQRLGSRRQYPFTAGYAVTDYKAQGQNMECVFVDIARPPRGTISLFNLYVALSRSSGRSTIRLLRDFDARVLCQKHDAFLLAEDDRINQLDRTTRHAWARRERS